MLGNRLWHTDASYMPVPVVLGMLHAVAVPPASALGGGETEFADMRAAYDALPEPMKPAIDPLIVEHDIFWSRAQIGFTEFARGAREYPPSRQRLVRRHPGSRRKTVYLSAHASHIVGWPVADGRVLLYDLNLHATRPEFVYSHKWRVGDLVIWDNRSTRCIAAARTTKPSRVTCAARQPSISAPHWKRPLERTRRMPLTRPSPRRRGEGVNGGEAARYFGMARCCTS